MIEKFERAMEDSERQRFEPKELMPKGWRHLSGVFQGMMIGTVPIIFGAAVIAFVVQSDLHVLAKGAVGAVAFVMAMAGLVIVISAGSIWRGDRRFRLHDKKWCKQLRDLMELGRIRVTRVTAHAVAVIKDYRDAPSTFVFDIGDGKLLVLNNAILPRSIDADRWPNSAFEILSVGETDLDLKLLGENLVPTQVISENELIDYSKLSFKGIVEGSLTGFIDDHVAREPR